MKSDVYGFGVILLEMLTGLRPFDHNRPRDKWVLVTWMKPHLKDRSELETIMDCRLEGKYPLEAAFIVAQEASRCLALRPKDRPTMSEVLEKLEPIHSVASSSEVLDN